MAFVAHYRKADESIQPLDEHLTIQPLDEHLKGVSNLSGVFAKKLNLEKAGKLIGILHDLGKYSEEFQNYLNSAVGRISPDEDDYVDAAGKKGTIDHSTAGAQYIWSYLQDKGNAEQLAGQILSICIASHHSGLIDCITPDGKDHFSCRMKKIDDKTHLEEAKSSADAEILSAADKILRDHDLIQTLTQAIKQIHQGSKDNNTVFYFQLGLLTRYFFSCLIDADRLDTANFESPENACQRQSGQYISWDKLINRLNQKLGSFEKTSKIDEIRALISYQCLQKSTENKGIYTLTVPTGGGKTLSSLRFALHHAEKHKIERIIYVIPYTSIIDQNAEEVRKILEGGQDEPGSIVLECHSNLVFESKESQWREKLLAENWDAPIIFTTSVQLLECLFGSGTRNARRMHQLANSIMIFDEIQTLPIRTVHMFNNAINFLTETCGSSVVLCTATQPLLNRVDPKKGCLLITAKNELIDNTNTSRLFADLKRVNIVDKTRPNNEWSDCEIAELAIHAIEQSGSCLIIVNTKAKAKSIYEVCKNQVDESTKIEKDTIYHLSTHMCAAHRTDIFDKIKANLGEVPVLCISTQLIEAGVDISFGCVIRSLAGMDSIAQSAGRCNRNNEQTIGQVYIVNLESEKTDRLLDISIGKSISERIFREYKENPDALGGDLLHTKVMERYFQYYFFDRKDEMKYLYRSKDDVAEDNLLNMLADNTQACAEYARNNNETIKANQLRHSFMTANKAFEVISAGTQGIIIPYGNEGKNIINDLCGTFEAHKDYETLKKAQRYTINVYPHMINKLYEARAIHETQENSGIFYLNTEHYSEKFGVSDNIVNALDTLHF